MTLKFWLGKLFCYFQYRYIENSIFMQNILCYNLCVNVIVPNLLKTPDFVTQTIGANIISSICGTQNVKHICKDKNM